MTTRAARTALAVFLGLFAWHAPALAQQQTAKQIVTTENGDYFGFDLRTEQNVTLDQCGKSCLGDEQCRAFTYNTKAKWCFLKSDYNRLNTFPGAVAGKVVSITGERDIGAPADLAFMPAYIVDEARNYRNLLAGQPVAGVEMGLAGSVAAGETALSTSLPAVAVGHFEAATAISPDDIALWLRLADAATIAVPNANDRSRMQQTATSAAFNAYLLSRSTTRRAEALAKIGAALEVRAVYRPAMSAYEASLALENSIAAQQAYASLKERHGFRIVDHSIDSDNQTPRVCVQFSEKLQKTGVDYANFVTVDDARPKAVEAGEQDVCVEGLEHGKHYRVAIRQGLPAAIGEVISRPTVLEIYIQDRSPSVRFTGDAFVLPSTARRGIPIVSVNMRVADLKLYRIGDRAVAQVLTGSQFLRQLDSYDMQRVADEIGEPVWNGKIDISPELNKEVVTSFPIDEALPDRNPGLYVLSAMPENDHSDEWQSKATQWFVVSDVGITSFSGQDGLTVFARSLGQAKPIAGVALSLVARNNEMLGQATTDSDGRARFDAGLLRGAAGLAPAALMANSGGKDFVFLDMTRAGFDLSDRGVEGRAAPGALDVLAWTERGIYRVGETVHVAALARDDASNAVDDLPLTFIFRRPDGVEDRRIVSDGAAMGGHAVDLPLEDTAMRGAWQVAIHTDPKTPAVANQQFLVEDFAPDRIEFDLKADKSEIALGETAEVTVDGRYLYGAPGADLALEGEINISTRRNSDRYKGYVFGLADEEGESSTRVPLEGLEPTDENGKAVIPVTLDNAPSTTRFLNAQLAVRMREGGGRAIERRIDIAVRPASTMIGIKPNFAGDSVPEGGNAGFNIIAVDSAGARQDLKGLAWKILRVERNYQWYRANNAWSYEPVVSTEQVADGTIDASATSEATLSFPVDWGHYRLEIETADPDGPVSSAEFYAGWYVETSSTETPDALELALDKEAYKPGETAKLKVSPRFAGELLLAIGSERILETKSVTIPEGGATIEVPVDGDWGTGAYLLATLHRPGESRESRLPSRAIGVKWLKIDPAERKLDVKIETVAKTQPRQKLTIPIAVTGIPAGEEAYVTVAAVDVGILNLTRYTAPDADGWYFGQRMLGLELRDLYGRLIDGSLGTTGRIRTGGDGGEQAVQGNPPKEKLLAFFAGPVKLDAEGRATVTFDIPQFNGTARVMAVAWSKKAVGDASSDVIIRDPVVVMASMPKFLAPGDQSNLRLEIANTDGPAGSYDLSIATGKEVSVSGTNVPSKVELAAGGRTVLTLPLAGVVPGDSTVTVRLAHASGTAVEMVGFVPVRPSVLPVTERRLVTLAPNGGSITVDRELFASSLIEGATVSVGVSRQSAFDIPALLMTLDRYPYGCAEQTTSRALPLLYVSELAKAAGMPEEPEIRGRVQDAIWRVLSYQSSSGSFGLWGPGSGDMWLDSYVTDFLTRAREQKYDVPEAAMMQALQNLQNSLAYDVNIQANGSEIAYALYVLARNQKASAADLRYYTDTQIDEFDNPLARAHLGASLALYGDGQRSERAFNSAFTLARATKAPNWDRSDYGSQLRDGAAMLALAGETRPEPSFVPAMIDYVSAVKRGITYTSTQEEAWMLLAARAIRSELEQVELEVNGGKHSGTFSQRLTGEAVAASPLTVVNRSAIAVDAAITTVASPAQPLPAGGNGFTIARTYYTMDGEEANVSEVQQNERYVAVIKVRENNGWPSRVLVNDLLPAGFEIDNPSLVGSAELVNFDWLGEMSAAHTEFRNDRFVAAFDRNSGSEREFNVAYVVRAVTPGVYDHPAASVEDMYRPQFSARTSTGRMEVVKPQ